MNYTIDDESPLAYLMSTEGTTNAGLLVGGVAAALVSIIYSMKHIKNSSCWGVKCQQAIVDAPQVVICPDGKPALTVSEV
tara:strand:- start:39 stop:278 length:240 start_codon:yes stop_codon:yes gene_type:complete